MGSISSYSLDKKVFNGRRVFASRVNKFQHWNVENALNYLLNKGLSAIHAKGILTNAWRESEFNARAEGDYGTSLGLFQWHAIRKQHMLKTLGSQWPNPFKQLDYLFIEPVNLSGYSIEDYKRTNFTSIQHAADAWMRNWERPASPFEASIKHQSIIKKLW